MKQAEQTQIRRKVLTPLVVMIGVLLTVFMIQAEWFHMGLTGIVGLLTCSFFYVYLRYLEKCLVRTYRNQQVEIVHRRFAEAQLTEAVERAESANQAKSEFLSNMSHELRTPMNAIVGFSDLLKEEELTTEQLDYVNTIWVSSEHLLSLINDVLDLSKIEAGKLEVVPETCQLRPLLSRVDTMMRSLATSKGLTFEVDINPALPDEFVADNRHLYQCLINLTANAIKFTEQGSVRIKADLIQRGHGKSIGFDVIDTGIGIALEKRGLIFESFQQADTSTSRKYGGTGLGLAITNKLIEMMGGELTVKSEEGRGSVFSIILPLSCPVSMANS